jgi:hypothetical protein
MERKALGAAVANYPYLQGLWAIPFGIGMVVAGVSNLQHRPSGPVLLGVFGGGLALCAVAALLITRHYRGNYGTVTPTRTRQLRHGVAIVAWAVVLFVGANRYLLWSPDSAVCVYAAAFAVATLVYYAVLVGLRTHHLVIWGLVFVAALLPVWGRLGADRDAVAMFPLAAALIASGLFDQRRLARSFRSPHLEDSSLEDSSLGG